jgi:hypothetical protein
MAPVARCGHGTRAGMRARRKDMSCIRDQGRARGVHGGKAASRSRLDDHKEFGGALQSFVQHCVGRGLRKLAQRIRNYDQIMLLTS